MTLPEPFSCAVSLNRAASPGFGERPGRLVRAAIGCVAIEEAAMPHGDKSSYTDKQKRQAEHIEHSERKEGKPKKEAERIAWATVNKQGGGGKKSGSGGGKH